MHSLNYIATCIRRIPLARTHLAAASPLIMILLSLHSRLVCMMQCHAMLNDPDIVCDWL